jgi:hypothetical protein
LAGVLREFDKAKAKTVLNEAADAVGRISRSESSSDDLRRRLVDLAYQIDPEYAAALSSQLDQDDGREIARSQIAYQKAKENVKNLNTPLENIPDSRPGEFQEIAWGFAWQFEC